MDKIKVLIIDDEIELCKVISSIINQTEDMTCDLTTDSLSGIKLLSNNKYDVCIIDINMGEVNGFETIKYMRSMNNLVPFIVLSGGSITDVDFNLIIDGFIKKPADPSEIIMNVRRVYHSTTLRNQSSKKDFETTQKKIVEVLITSMEFRDDYTGNHSKRVSDFSVFIAKEYNLQAKKEIININEMKIGSLLHDIGKISIEDSILRKQGSLTDEEWKIIRKHPEKGCEMVEKTKELRFTMPYILCHHEAFDGSGYPWNLKGEQIPLVARIVAIADSFDAMTTKRIYKSSIMSIEEVKKDFLSNPKYDKNLINLFFKSMNF